jgi:hypothetical protein
MKKPAGWIPAGVRKNTSHPNLNNIPDDRKADLSRLLLPQPLFDPLL